MIEFQTQPRATVFSAAAQGPGETLLRALVDEIDCGVIVCNVHGSVCFANQAARQESHRADVPQTAALALRCVAGDATALHAAIRVAALNGRRQMLRLSHGENRLMVSIVPLPAQTGPDARVLLLLGRRGSCSALGLEMLAIVHGLTLAERRVLAGLLAEASPREVAATLGVALSTVRTHILAIRTKLGVRSIEAILLRAAEVPPMAALVRSVPAGGWHEAAAQRPGRPCVSA